jgi:hypothetical protein
VQAPTNHPKRPPPHPARDVLWTLAPHRVLAVVAGDELTGAMGKHHARVGARRVADVE